MVGCCYWNVNHIMFQWFTVGLLNSNVDIFCMFQFLELLLFLTYISVLATRTTVAYFTNPQYQYGQGPSYIPRGQAINPPPYSNSGYSQPITQPGSSRPTAPTQQADRLQQKRPPDQPEGIQAPPPPAFALPANHNIV